MAYSCRVNLHGARVEHETGDVYPECPEPRWWVFYWQYVRHHVKDFSTHLFWIRDCYTYTVCGTLYLWASLMMASLGDAEGWPQVKRVRIVKALGGGWAGKGLIWLTWMQMWIDLLTMWLERYKIYKQPNAVLLEVWKQLRLEQQFAKYEKRPEQKICTIQLEDFMPTRHVSVNSLFCFE